MKAKLDPAWRKYRTEAVAGGLSKWVGQLTFENTCRKLCGVKVSIEWQEDGGVIVAGVIAFNLT